LPSSRQPVLQLHECKDVSGGELLQQTLKKRFKAKQWAILAPDRSEFLGMVWRSTGSWQNSGKLQRHDRN
jgi:hypothetical protein